MEYWHSTIAGRWLVAEKATGRIVAQLRKRQEVLAVFPTATLCFEMGA